MKKILSFLLTFSCLLGATACESFGKTPDTDNSNSIEDTGGSDSPAHVHDVIKMAATDSSCTESGNIEYYFCWSCQAIFSDAAAEHELSDAQIRTELAPHTPTKVEGSDATCDVAGALEHWQCTVCKANFADEACTQRLNASQIEIPSTDHDLTFHEGYPVNGDQNGQIDHWTCNNCGNYFLEEAAESPVEAEDVILYSAANLPDFIVEIPSGRDPVVLQLSDTQIIDGAQSRPEQSAGDKITYATQLVRDYCYNYLTETVNTTKPDFIILTGDIIYGKYDDNGSALKSLINFMEDFKIPWAPVFGNHENESRMGADWQCEQLENAEYCLFEQGDLMGNGNYSVGLMQDGALKRVFYMLDSHGCSAASDESIANGHTSKSVGFYPDQIEWYTEEIQAIKALSPDTKISFAYHIQQAVFGEAFAKYGFDQSTKYQDINIDLLENKAEGDFGYIGRQMKDPWDSTKTIFNGMKELGVDSIFVGHEHCNSASVVYEGVRLQYGQKSSEYDRYNFLTSDNKIVAGYLYDKPGTPMVGGSVIVLSSSDFSIKDAYIYLCKKTSST